MEINIWYILAGLFYLGHGVEYVNSNVKAYDVNLDAFGGHVVSMIMVLFWPVASIAITIIKLIRIVIDSISSLTS